jgi:hypothetical protein
VHRLRIGLHAPGTALALPSAPKDAPRSALPGRPAEADVRRMGLLARSFRSSSSESDLLRSVSAARTTTLSSLWLTELRRLQSEGRQSVTALAAREPYPMRKRLLLRTRQHMHWGSPTSCVQLSPGPASRPHLARGRRVPSLHRRTAHLQGGHRQGSATPGPQLQGARRLMT